MAGVSPPEGAMARASVESASPASDDVAVPPRPRFPLRAWLPLVLFAALALVPPLAILTGAEGYFVGFATRVVALAIAAVALDLVIGYAGLVSFGHAAFLGIGAYAVAIMGEEGVESLLVILPVALAASAAFAALTGAISLRTSGVYFIMITLAFAQMLFFTLSSLSAYGGDDGVTLWYLPTVLGADPLSDPSVLFYVALLALAAAYALCRWMVGTRFGRVLRAARENPVRVAAVGHDVFRHRLVAYTVSGTIAGAAGVLLALQAEYVSPAIAAWPRSGDLIFMVVLGGMGSLHGAILGAVAFVVLEEALSEITQHWPLVFGPFLILVVLFARGGLVGLLDRIGR